MNRACSHALLRLAVALTISRFCLEVVPVYAMNMPSYDDVSLTYLSTDIVLADISENPKDTFTATVTEVLYGQLHPGDKLDSLTQWFTFFRPIKGGMRLLLFLDRRPQKFTGIFASEFSKLPFAIPPSGIHLIDKYEHVHTYFQMMNPGPYVATGWFSGEPSKEVDLKLPTLDEERVKIASAIKVVEPVRRLLARQAGPEDVPSLLGLLDQTSDNTKDCDLRLARAITERAMEQIRAQNDPALLLKAHIIAGDADSWQASAEFINSAGDDISENGEFAVSRAQFLIGVLSDPTKDIASRLAATELLLMISAWNHPYSGVAKVLPLDAKPIAGSADRLRSLAKAIFENDSEDGNLRGLSLEFLLDQPGILDEARKIYRQTGSSTLRFMIEELFLAHADSEYDTLHSPSGPVASIVGHVETCGCVAQSATSPLFVAEFFWRKNVQFGGTPGTVVRRTLLLTKTDTGQQFWLEHYDEAGYSISAGSSWIRFTLNHLDNIPAGDYFLALQSRDGEKIVSTGYSTRVTIRETPQGKRATAEPNVNAAPVGWID